MWVKSFWSTLNHFFQIKNPHSTLIEASINTIRIAEMIWNPLFGLPQSQVIAVCHSISKTLLLKISLSFKFIHTGPSFEVNTHSVIAGCIL